MPISDAETQSQAEQVFGVRPCLWQIKAARAILEGHDVLTVAPTGAGKTHSYWLVLPFSNGTVLLVTPLKDLSAQLGFNTVNVTGNIASNELYSETSLYTYMRWIDHSTGGIPNRTKAPPQSMPVAFARDNYNKVSITLLD